MGSWTVEVLGFPITLSWLSVILPVYAWWLSRLIIGRKAAKHEAGLVGRLSLVAAMLVLATIAIHEVGHAVMAMGLGVKVVGAGILPIGAYVQHEPTTPAQSLAISLAGPMVQLIASGAILAIAKPRTRSIRRTMWLFVAHLSAFTALLNLLPFLPLDGGRVFDAIALITTNNPDVAITLGPVLSAVLVLAWIKSGLSRRLFEVFRA